MSTEKLISEEQSTRVDKLRIFINRLLTGGKIDHFPHPFKYQMSRRDFMRLAVGVGVNTALNPIFPVNKAAKGEELREHEVVPESELLEQQLEMVADTWDLFKFDKLLQENIEAATFFGNKPEKYKDRQFAQNYQRTFQTTDFFVDIDKLVKAYQENPETAVDLLLSTDYKTLRTFRKIIVPMFEVLHKCKDKPQEDRERLIAAAYTQQRLDYSHATIAEIRAELLEDPQIELSQHSRLFVKQSLDTNDLNKPKKIGPVIYNQSFTDKNEKFTRTELELIILEIESLNASYPGLAAMTPFLQSLSAGAASASVEYGIVNFNGTNGSLVNIIFGFTTDHEIIGHCSPIEVFDKWKNHKDHLSLLNRFSFDPRLILSGSKEKMNAISYLVSHKDRVVECSIPNFKINQLIGMSTEEIIESQLSKEIGQKKTQDLIEIVKNNSTNYVKMLAELLELSKNTPESDSLLEIIEILVDIILHYHIDIHINYSNQFRNLGVIDPLGQISQKNPIAMAALIAVDPRLIAAFDIFRAKIMMVGEYGSSGPSNQEILDTFAQRKKVVTDYLETHLFSLFESTKDRKIAPITDFGKFSDILLLMICQLKRDFIESPLPAQTGNDQDLQEAWLKLTEQFSHIADNVVKYSELNDDPINYMDGVFKLSLALLSDDVTEACEGFFENVLALINFDSPMYSYITSLAPLYALYKNNIVGGQRYNINNEIIMNIAKYLLLKTGPLLFAYDNNTHTLNYQIFTDAKAYFDRITVTTYHIFTEQIAQASDGVAEVLELIPADVLEYISQNLNLATQYLEHVEITVVSKDGSRHSEFSENRFDSARHSLQNALEAAVESVQEFDSPEAKIFTKYLEDIIYRQPGPQNNQNFNSYLEYLIYRTKFAMSGILDAKSIQVRLDQSPEDPMAHFPRLGMDDNDQHWSVEKAPLIETFLG